MPKLILQLEDRVLKEYDMGMMATIGRLSDNSVMIDRHAVSSHHACVSATATSLSWKTSKAPTARSSTAPL